MENIIQACNHENPCADCANALHWLLHDPKNKREYMRIDPPRLDKCSKCEQDYHCQYCSKLASRLKMAFPNRTPIGGTVVEVTPMLSNAFRNRFPEEASKDLQLGLVSGKHEALTLDGVWLTAIDKRKEPISGLITPHNSWARKLERLKSLLAECEGGHAECKGHNRTVSLQTTAIFLLDLKGRQLVRSDIGTASYVCLSYVWGQSEHRLELRKSALEQLMNEGSLDNHKLFDPPLTVRNTMEFVMAMGERYLWIDRYCIVQDDGPHKDAQLKNMCHIYASARFTVIAADGTATDGLVGWNLRPIPDEEQSNLWYENETYQVLAGVGLEENPFNSGTWDTRGWTLQEKLYSSKTIIFNSGMVFWRCLNKFWQQDLLYSSRTHSRDLPPLVLPPWPSLIYLGFLALQYATRELTFSSDSMQAFSGVLAYLEPHFPGGFLFGMSELWFDIALLWEPSDIYLLDRFKEDETTCVPTWSWARWRGNINFHPWGMSTQYVFLDEKQDPTELDLPLPKDADKPTKDYLKELSKTLPCPITPMVKWFNKYQDPKTLTTRQRRVLNCYDDFKRYENNAVDTPPRPWIRCPRSERCAYQIDNPLHSEPPFYKQPIYSTEAVSAASLGDGIPLPIIFGQVKRRFLRVGTGSGIRLKDVKSIYSEPNRLPNFQLLSLDKSEQVGTVTLNGHSKYLSEIVNSGSKEIVARLGIEDETNRPVVEIIVISASECACLDKPYGTMYFELFQWEQERGKSCPGGVYRYYNVLFIYRREDNVAERLGLGRVARDLWDQGDEMIDIELG
jgi:hypothetical protein